MTHPYQPAWKRREARGLDAEPDELPGNPPVAADGLDGLTVTELRAEAKAAGVVGASRMAKHDLVAAIRSAG